MMSQIHLGRRVLWAPCWWASSSDTHVYPSIFAFSLLPLHCQSTTMHPHTNMTTRDCTCLVDGHMFYNSHLLFLFLVSPMCALPWSNQSWTLALHGQALTIASLWMSLMLTFLFAICINLPVFTFHSREEPDNLPIWVSPRIQN